MIPRAPAPRTDGPRRSQVPDDRAARVSGEADALRLRLERLAAGYRDGGRPAACDLDAAMEAARRLQRHVEALRCTTPVTIELERTLTARQSVAAASAAVRHLSTALRAS